MKNGGLSNFFQSDGKTVILPIDHGTAIPVPGLEKPGELIKAVKPHVDGFVVNYGVARACAQELKGKGVCLRTDVYKPDVSEGAFRVYGAEDALELGASAMMQMLYPGHKFEAEQLRECALAVTEGRDAGIPLIIEVLPDGLGKTKAYTCEKIGFAVRQAAELGADVVKTAFPVDGSAKKFRAIVESALVPVIVLGGAAMGDDKALLKMVGQAMKAGAAGVAIGRNVWQHPDPAGIAKKIAAIVHEGASTVEALEIV